MAEVVVNWSPTHWWRGSSTVEDSLKSLEEFGGLKRKLKSGASKRSPGKRPSLLLTADAGEQEHFSGGGSAENIHAKRENASTEDRSRKKRTVCAEPLKEGHKLI